MEKDTTRLLDAAVKIAEKTPLHSVTRGAIAKKAKIAPSLVSYYLGTMDDMRTLLVARAIELKNVAALATAIAARHPGAANAPEGMKREALRLLAV